MRLEMVFGQIKARFAQKPEFEKSPVSAGVFGCKVGIEKQLTKDHEREKPLLLPSVSALSVFLTDKNVRLS